MSDLVPADQIEQIVGAHREHARHIARAVSAEERVYVLHSEWCREHHADLRDCGFSRALDNGIVPAEWPPDVPVVVMIRPGAVRGGAARTGHSVTEYLDRVNAGLRWCFRDQAWEPASEFGKDSSRSDGLDRVLPTIPERGRARSVHSQAPTRARPTVRGCARRGPAAGAAPRQPPRRHRRASPTQRPAVHRLPARVGPWRQAA